MKFKLSPGQFAVIFAEFSTGIVLTEDGKQFLGEGTPYKTFNSCAEAEAFSRIHVGKHPERECSIHDEHGEHVTFIRPPQRD